jgi:hypothetical protein
VTPAFRSGFPAVKPAASEVVAHAMLSVSQPETWSSDSCIDAIVLIPSQGELQIVLRTNLAAMLRPLPAFAQSRSQIALRRLRE